MRTQRQRTWMTVASTLAPIMAVLGATLWALPAWSGGQGVGLGTPPPPTPDDEVRRYLMNAAGEAPARYVCVDAPATECFDVAPDQPAPPFGTTTLRSDDCPGTQACQPDTVAGTDTTATLVVEIPLKSEWQATDVSAQHAFTCFFGNPQVDQIIQPAGYDTVLEPALGSDVYVDTNIEFVDIPTSLSCAEWIRTASGDVASTSATHLQFVPQNFSYVYVGYEASATQVPSWLSQDFSLTGDQIEVDGLAGNTLYDVWRSDQIQTADLTVTLGGNQAGGGNGSEMYLVVVRPPEATELCGDWSASVSLDAPGGPYAAGSVAETNCYHYDALNAIFLTPKPLLLPGGIGYFSVGASQNFDCSIWEYERTFGAGGLFDRAALIDAAEQAFPSELSGFRAGVSMVGSSGIFGKGTQVGGDPLECEFDVTFTPPAETRVVLNGAPANNVDTNPATEVTIVNVERGVVEEIDVYLELSGFGFLGADSHDEVNSTIEKDGFSAGLDQRVGCSSAFATTAVSFDDDSANPPPSGCGSLSGDVRPTDSLSGALATTDVAGTWTLSLLDQVDPSAVTDLDAWQLRILTEHTQCSDGLDNDGDGGIDFDGGVAAGTPDGQCVNAFDNREKSGGRGCGLGGGLLPLLVAFLTLGSRRRG